MAVYDKETGEKVATVAEPESLEGQKIIDKLKDGYDINYAPGGTANAPDMRESYQLGGQVPGQPGFGQRPAPVVPGGLGQKPEGLQPQGYMGNITEGLAKSGIMEPTPRYKKGGKVKKKGQYGGGITD